MAQTKEYIGPYEEKKQLEELGELPEEFKGQAELKKRIRELLAKIRNSWDFIQKIQAIMRHRELPKGTYAPEVPAPQMEQEKELGEVYLGKLGKKPGAAQIEREKELEKRFLGKLGKTPEEFRGQTGSEKLIHELLGIVLASSPAAEILTNRNFIQKMQAIIRRIRGAA